MRLTSMVSPALLARLEEALQQQLASVRIETGNAADVLCGRVEAEAVTQGSTISFARGMFDVRSHAGHLRLAHELIHVVQNRLPPATLYRGVSNPFDDAEIEAACLAPLVARGEPVVVRAQPVASVLCVYTENQKRGLMGNALAGAKDLLNGYIQSFGSVNALWAFYSALGAGAFTTLGLHYYPDQMKSLKNNWTTPELQQLVGLSALTLTGLESVSLDWQHRMLRVLRDTLPNATAVTPRPNGLALVPAATVGVLAHVDQTAQHLNLANTVVTERNNNGVATRNLVFNGLGVCVAEVNFDNHGFNAVSGHLHVYPVWAMPITGHHISGTPEFAMADYPALWRALPVGVNPRTPLGN
jgi:hypothetical protein